MIAPRGAGRIRKGDTMSTTEMAELRRDERGRIIADDGLPVSGLATITEAVAVSSLSRSQLYQMVNDGQLEVRRFGRAVRIPWSEIRAKLAH